MESELKNKLILRAKDLINFVEQVKGKDDPYIIKLRQALFELGDPITPIGEGLQTDSSVKRFLETTEFLNKVDETELYKLNYSFSLN